MRLLSCPQLVLFLLVTLLCVTNAKRGGGSRGGSRSSSRSSSRTRYSDRSRDRGSPSAPAPIPIPRAPPAPAPAPKPPAPPPKKPPAPKPSAPEEPVVARQPAHNPNFRESSPNQGASQPASNPNYPGQNVPSNRQPPPYSPGVAPPAYSPAGQSPPHAPAGAPPAYSPGAQPPPYAPAGQAPPYSPPGPGFRPGINPPAYPQQPGMRPAPYPQQPGMGSAPYPQQPGMRPAPYPQQPGMGSAPYPRQPGMSYPQQPGMNRPYQQQPLGSNVWTPHSGMPAPAYMNYGGLPTGGNMYGKPHKQKGFLGSLMSLGGTKHNSKNKYYGSYPGSYGMGGGLGGMGGRGGGFLGRHGKSAAMFAILPYMAMRSSHSLFMPRLGFFPLFLPSPFYHHHHYGYGYGHSHYYDVYNENYAGKCKRPITPIHGAVQCNSTYRETRCHFNCTEGYQFPDNTTMKDNECWHVTGVWRPEKNFPECKPVCNESCLNGGSCIQPGMCGCLPEYRGLHCEFHFLNCDVRKLAGSTKISWVCTHTRNETSCKIKCKTPTVFAVEPASEYKCAPDGVWTPDSIPECIIKDDVTTEIASTVEVTTAD
ncbi:homeobox protein Hox-A3-like isoform X2 [Uloborus diversus]|uniref:homeobox protein Hox-A3-like isoform X2 n=1 Tax=Uloborus diversus TaxID=327109 RepID=UPI00240A7624|nr:homeobox protein Hox-A3-like isoform X2 [Uloborus diversus]